MQTSEKIMDVTALFKMLTFQWMRSSNFPEKFERIIKSAIFSYKAALLISILVIGMIYSAIVPPLQSPDEPAHVKRAYLLLKGVVVLETPSGMSSGGYIDDGLLSYFTNYSMLPHNPDNTVTRKNNSEAKCIRWSHTLSFSPAPGNYFPFIYAPSASGLFLGEQLDLTIDQSYRLARFFSFATSVLIIAIAFSVFPTNFFVLGVLILPMVVFQIVSASIDGVSTALSILSISLFMRATNKSNSFPDWMAYLLAGCLFVVVTCRSHLLPMIIFPLVIYGIRKQRSNLWAFIAVTIISAIWLFVALSTSVDLSISRDFTSKYIAHYYLTNPIAFVDVLVGTLKMIPSYIIQFIGVLGWLDTPLPDMLYKGEIIILNLLAVLSIERKSFVSDYKSRLTLLTTSFFSILLIFFALLVAWTPHPALLVAGVQGRYFIVPFIMLGYALAGDNNLFAMPRAILAILVLYLTVLIEAYLMADTLILRYYYQSISSSYDLSTVFS